MTIIPPSNISSLLIFPRLPPTTPSENIVLCSAPHRADVVIVVAQGKDGVPLTGVAQRYDISHGWGCSVSPPPYQPSRFIPSSNTPSLRIIPRIPPTTTSDNIILCSAPSSVNAIIVVALGKDDIPLYSTTRLRAQCIRWMFASSMISPNTI